jgi:hypothetical protein
MLSRKKEAELRGDYLMVFMLVLTSERLYTTAGINP